MAATINGLHEALRLLSIEKGESVYKEAQTKNNGTLTVALGMVLAVMLHKGISELENTSFPSATAALSSATSAHDARKQMSDASLTTVQNLYKSANAKGKEAIGQLSSNIAFSQHMKDSSNYASKDFGKIADPRVFYKSKTGVDFSAGELDIIKMVASLGGKDVAEKFATLKKAGIEFSLTDSAHSSLDKAKSSISEESRYMRVDQYANLEFNKIYDKVQIQLTEHKISEHPELKIYKQDDLNINNKLFEGADKSNYGKWEESMAEKDHQHAHLDHQEDHSFRM